MWCACSGLNLIFFYLLTSLFARLHVKQMRSFVLSKLIQLRDLISEQFFLLEKGSLLNPLDMKLSLAVRHLLCGNLNCLYPTCASNLRIILTWRLWYGIYIFSPSFQRIEQWTWGHSNWSITLVLHSTGSIPCWGTERLWCFFWTAFPINIKLRLHVFKLRCCPGFNLSTLNWTYKSCNSFWLRK